MCSVFLTCHAKYLWTWWNQSDTMRTTYIFKKNAPRLLFFFENHPFGRYWPIWIFRTGPLKSSLSLIGSIGYPDMWGVQNNLSLSNNYEKSVSRLPLLWKSPFVTFLALFGPFLTFLKAPLKSKLSLIGLIRSKRHPDMSRIQNTLSLSKNLEKSASRLPSSLKITLFTFWPFLGRFWLWLRYFLSLHCLWFVP